MCTSIFLCFEMCEYVMLFLSRLEGIFHAYCVYSYFLRLIKVGHNVMYLLGHIVMVLHRDADV